MSLTAVIDSAGITAPNYAEIYAELQQRFRSIYGTDAYLDPDSQDGQLLAIFAKALHDANQTAVQAYYSFSPATAVGAALSNNVLINGISRKVPTRSQVILSLIGVANTPVLNGVVSDVAGNKWELPELVVIDHTGTAVVNATAINEGEIRADPDTITTIVTTTKGWQSVTNHVAAIPGAPVESDGALRIRQAASTANPAQGLIKSINGSVAAIEGVVRCRTYENDTNVPNADGHPPHSITVVALGGDPQEIARVIHLRKTPGAYTHGTTAVSIVVDDWPNLVRFFIADQIRVKVKVVIKALPGFLATTVDLIKTNVANYINALGIGVKVDQGRLYLPAQFYGTSELTSTFEVNMMLLTSDPLGAHLDQDLVIPFNGLAVCIASEDVMIEIS